LSLSLVGLVLPAAGWAVEPAELSTVDELEPASSQAADLLVQQPEPESQTFSQTPPETSQPTQITGVKLQPAAASLEIVLETAEGQSLPIDASKFRTEGNSLIAEIPSAVLALPEAQEFQAENPTADITVVSVTQVDANTVRVSVTGNNALPKSDVSLKVGAFAYSLNPETEQTEEEIIVTGDRGGYTVPDSSVGTRTNIPIRDVPQSIQVIPRQVIEDQAANDIEDVLRNVSGVAQQGGDAAKQINIRGLDATDNIVTDGISIGGVGQLDFDLSNIEQVEVLKGPSSVLYGSGEPGGKINLVTKKPLPEPFYELKATVGNFDFYQGTVDLTGPLNDNQTILYRLNASYGNTGSFIDFVESGEFALFPVVSFQVGKNTTLILKGSYENQSEILGTDLPVVGTVLPNPLGQIPRNRFLGEPDFNRFKTSRGYVGFSLDHRFSDDWSIRNQFIAAFATSNFRQVFFDALEDDNRTVTRSANQGEGDNQTYTLQTDLNGKFKTGIINHDLLVGVELGQSISTNRFRDAANTPSIDLFEPEYGNLPTDFEGTLDEKIVGNTMGVYAQDLLAIGDKVKILIGGRFDLSSERFEDRLAGTTDTNGASAFSPRVGIVYQPIKPVSLYAGWSRSFTPNFGTDFNGNPFKPTTGEQFEVGIKNEFLNGKVTSTLAAYQITRKNDFVADPDNPGFDIQIGEQRSRGMDFDLSGEVLPGLRLIATYAYTDARITEDTTGREGNRLGSVPQHSGSLWAVYELQAGTLKGFGFGAGIFAVGDFPNNSEDDAVEVPGYLRTDALLYYRRDNWRMQFNIQNLFNTEYFETPFGGVVYGAPFTVKGQISVTF
jgi:iron complex outermembrane receptor protein